MATSVMSRGRPAVVSPGCVTVVVQWPDREWRGRRDPSSSPVHRADRADWDCAILGDRRTRSSASSERLKPPEPFTNLVPTGEG